MKIQLNGQERILEKTANISELVIELGLEPRSVLIEHNQTALHRSEWSTCIVSEGDFVEILFISAGG